MKVAELEGLDLDIWVARAEGRDTRTWLVVPRNAWYSSRWEFGGPIIERERIDIAFGNEPDVWEALVRPEYKYGTYMCDDGRGKGSTPLIAAMRAYVASKFGDEVADDAK